jgi:hypothetical protein
MPREWTPGDRERAREKALARETAKKAAALEPEAPALAQESAPEPAPEIEIMPPMPDETGGSVMPEFEDDGPPLDVPADLTPWGVFLSSLSAETRELLDENELRGAFETAAREAREERRRQLKTAAAAKAKMQARQLAGLTTPEQRAQQELDERNSRLVQWKVQLPFVADTNGVAAEGLTIDGERLYHGQDVKTTWAKWRSCLSIIWNLRQHELDFKGESRLSSLRRMNVAQGTRMSVS